MAEKNDKRTKRAKIRKEDKNEVDAFIERPVPENEEVEYFDKAVRAQQWRGDVESNLQAIYEDRNGRMIDVKKIKKRRPRLIILRVFKWLLWLFLLGIAGYLSYQYLSDPSLSGQSLEMTIQAPTEIDANEGFTYQIGYRNLTRQAIKNIRLEVVLPDNFIWESSSSASTTPGIYQVADLNPRGSGLLEIKGRILGSDGSVNVANAKIRYSVGDFTSEFLKEAGINTIIKGVGLQVAADYSDVVLSGSDQALSLSFSNITRDPFGPMRISVNLPDKTRFNGAVQAELEAAEDSGITVEKTSESSWTISGLKSGLEGFKLTWHYLVEDIDKGEITLILEEQDQAGLYHPIWQKKAAFEAVKSDLNLILLANGSKSDNSADFSSRIEYVLSYENHGSSSLRDVILVASVQGGFVDWNSLQTEVPGSVASNAILWDKSSYAPLAQIDPGESGEIKFSLGIKAFDETQLSADPTINSYAQFKLADASSIGDEYNRSNSIRTNLNSDFSLSEKILYFDEDNIPVGSGPLPPQVGQKSSFKVYWTLRNNLHELGDAKVTMQLPGYMEFENGQKNSVGSVYYDESSRIVTWDIGRLPISVYRADAEFSISITPSESDRNKILVISSGSWARAIDSSTGASLQKQVKAKTTKLEDDEIAGLSNSGIVN